MKTLQLLDLTIAIFDQDALCSQFNSLDNYEPHLTPVLEKIIQPNFNIVDAGCHLGFHTVRFSKLAPKGMVYAFDINEEALDLLEHTIKTNNLTNVKVYHKGLSQESKKIRYKKNIHPDQNSLYESYSKTFTGEAEAELTTLDELNLGKVYLLKLDVEGSELDILKGSYNTIKESRPLIIYENLNNSNLNPATYLSNLEYEIYQIEPSRDFLAIPIEDPYNTKQYFF
jgi:FkbM family methyltransferase